MARRDFLEREKYRNIAEALKYKNADKEYNPAKIQNEINKNKFKYNIFNAILKEETKEALNK